jgi:hypothetical protein
MFNALEDASLLGKKMAGRTSSLVATNSAVAVSAPFVTPAYLPFITLAVHVPIKAAISTMEHYHREEAILNNFREEIAGKFGVEPDEVTHDNLRYLAFGNKKLGIEPQPVFKEILEKNDKMRWIDIGANVGATALTMGFVALEGWKISGLATSLAANSGIAALASTAAAPLIGAVALSLAIAGVVTVCDYFITKLAKDVTDTPEKTGYELLENMSRQKSRGVEITQDKVMAVFATADKGLKTEIMNDYGAPYNALPQKDRMAVLDKYRSSLNIEQVTNQINHGVIKVNELAFIVAGDRSGVPEQEPKPITHKQGFGEKIHSLGQSVQHNIGGLFNHHNTKIANIQAATPATISTNVADSNKTQDMPLQVNFDSNSQLFPESSVSEAPKPSTDKPSNKLSTAGVQLAGALQYNSPVVSKAIH